MSDGKCQPLLGRLSKNGIEWQNKIVMSALTRLRADPKDGIPNELIVEHYTQRADCGMIIAEAAPISQRGNLFPAAGCIHSDETISGWKKVTESVHKKGAKIYLQIMHAGRLMTASLLKEGEKPIAPSAIPANGQWMGED